MKFILAVAVLLVFFGSLWADYRWRRWMKARKDDRNEEQSRDVK